MANFATIAREQDAQRELLELVLRNQVAIMSHLSSVNPDKYTTGMHIMLNATAKWLDTEAKTPVNV